MGLLGKLKFWKKNDDLGMNMDMPPDMGTDFKDNLALDQGSTDNMFNSHSGFEPVETPSSFNEKQRYDSYSQTPSNKELELISSKLDTIKAELDAMSQRIQKIEKIAEKTEKTDKNDSRHQPVW